MLISKNHSTLKNTRSLQVTFGINDGTIQVLFQIEISVNYIVYN